MAETNYIRSWRRANVRTRCVKFQSTDYFVLRTVSLKQYPRLTLLMFVNQPVNFAHILMLKLNY